MEFTPQHFERGLAAAGELLPTLKGRRLAYTMNGLFSFTPDGLPVLGESREVRGLWVAEGVWITHAGGVGKAMAEWMTEGAPSLDLRECDINRFHPHALTQDYIRARGAQQYREVYDVIHPLQQIGFPRNLRLSPFHGRMEALGAFFFESAGWERPQWFESNTSLLCERDTHTRSGWESKYWSPTQGVEHRTTRESVAMFDLTPFAKVEVRGAGALEYLQRLCANQIDQPVGSVVYTSMLNQRGGIVADLTVSRLGDDRFLVVRGGAMGLHDLAWMLRHLPQDGSVQLTDVTSSYCCIGLWGPRARDLAGRLTADDLSSSAFPSFTAKRVDIGNIPALALRVSYVGEAGWEIYTQTNYGAALWDALWDAGRPFGLAAAGGGAFDSLRLEKGYRLWGSDIHSEYNPLEAGLGFAVNFDKGDFLGREALLEAKDLGLTRKLSRLYFDEPDRVVMGKEPIIADDRVVGYVTSSNYGYTLGKGIAYGNLPIDLAKEGERVEVYYFGEMHPATVMREPR
jgi:glycine cleavage system T protein